MILNKLFNTKNELMSLAVFISGQGSNLMNIIEYEREIKLSKGRLPYIVSVIFSDNHSSNAVKIGEYYNIPVIMRDLGNFYKERGKSKRDLDLRVEFDKGTIEALNPFNIDVIAYAGYMSLVTPPLISAFLGINVHPADLSIMENGKRKYTGLHAVRDAIIAGERELRSSTHIVESKLDSGKLLMISAPLKTNISENFNLNDLEQVNIISKKYQERLKEIGDKVIFPKTLEFIANGRYSQDSQRNLYFDCKQIPQGVRLNE